MTPGYVAYPSYQEVNTRWHGRLPSSWRLVRLRYLCTIQTGSGDTQDAVPDADHPFFVRSPTPLRSPTATFDTEAILTAGDGDVGEIFHHYVGKFHAHQRVYVLTGFASAILPRFLFYAFSAHFRLMASDGSARTTVDSVRRWMLTDMPIAVPPLREQEAIVKHLDRETAQIDALIGEQKRFVSLLTERKEAAIAHALESEPATTTLRRHVLGIRQGWSPNCESSSADGVEEWAVLKVGCTRGGVFNARDNKRLPADVEPRPEHVIRRGEIVMSRSNTLDLVGTPAPVTRNYPRLMLSDLCYALTTARSLDPQFAVYALLGRRGRREIEMRAKGTSPSMKKLSQQDVLSLPLWVPDLARQRSIVSQVASHTAHISALTAEAHEYIALAKERRAALITAAVTGQIDVTKKVS